MTASMETQEKKPEAPTDPFGFETFEEFYADGKATWDAATVEEREWFRKAAKRLLGIDS